MTFDEWGGFYDHVPPPQVIDDTNPANVMHAGDSTTPTDGQLIPNYRQLGFRVPAHRGVQPGAAAPGGARGPVRALLQPRLIESTFGLSPLTARDRHARNLREVLLPEPVPAPLRGAAVLHPDQLGRDRPGDQPAVGVAAAGAHGHRGVRPRRHLLGRQRAVGVPRRR